MIEVLEARPEHDARVGEILVEAFVEKYAEKMPEVVVTEERKRELRAVADKRLAARVLVALVDGELAGTVTLFKPGAPDSQSWLPGAADLRHLAVDLRFHGRGISKALLEAAEAVARDEWGCGQVSLHVRRGAHGVARLYESRGYRRDPAGDREKPGVFLTGYVLDL